MTEHVRAAPINLESEQALLGAVLLHNNVYPKVANIVSADHFAEEIHRSIWAVMSAIIEKGEAATPITLKTYLGDADLGGLTVSQYLARPVAEATTISNAPSYARTVRALAARRMIIGLTDEISGLAYDMPVEETVEALFAKLEKRIEQVRPTIAPDDAGFVDFGSIDSRDVYEAYQNGGTMTGVSTGLEGLDEKLGGLQPSDLIILAGRPGSGKTALATHIAYHAAVEAKLRAEAGGDQGVVGFFSLEMGRRQLKNRIISSLADIEYWKLRRGKASQEEMERYFEAERALRKLPLEIDETGALSIAQVAMRARHLKRRKGLRLLVVDYLQLMQGTRSRGDNRVQEVTEITTGLKALAKELGVPVIALSQLSRKVEERDDKRPMLSDLRESGSIEQDADSVIFVYRDEYYLKDRAPKNNPEAYAKWERAMAMAAGVAELIIGKNRHGGSGWVEVGFVADYTRFTNTPPPKPVLAEEAQERVRNFKPTKPGQQVLDVLQALLISKGQDPSEEVRKANPRLSTGAKVIPLEVCVEAFKDNCYPMLSDNALKTKFSEGMNNLRDGGWAAYAKLEEQYFCWLPARSAE